MSQAVAGRHVTAEPLANSLIAVQDRQGEKNAERDEHDPAATSRVAEQQTDAERRQRQVEQQLRKVTRRGLSVSRGGRRNATRPCRVGRRGFDFRGLAMIMLPHVSRAEGEGPNPSRVDPCDASPRRFDFLTHPARAQTTAPPADVKSGPLDSELVMSSKIAPWQSACAGRRRVPHGMFGVLTPIAEEDA